MNLYFATFFVGVNTAAAKSFLGAASSVGDSLTADSSSSSQAQGARAAQLRVLETWLFLCAAGPMGMVTKLDVSDIQLR